MKKKQHVFKIVTRDARYVETKDCVGHQICKEVIVEDPPEGTIVKVQLYRGPDVVHYTMLEERTVETHEYRFYLVKNTTNNVSDMWNAIKNAGFQDEWLGYTYFEAFGTDENLAAIKADKQCPPCLIKKDGCNISPLSVEKYYYGFLLPRSRIKELRELQCREIVEAAKNAGCTCTRYGNCIYVAGTLENIETLQKTAPRYHDGKLCYTVQNYRWYPMW